MLKIKAIEAPNGVLIQIEGNKYSSSFLNHLFDGVNPQKTYHEGWMKLKKPVTKIELPKAGQPINHRYELIDKSFANDKVKEVFQRDEIAEYDDYYYRWEFKEEYAHLASLYKAVHDMSEPTLEVLEFEYEVIVSLAKLPSLTDFSFEAQRDRFAHQGFYNITPKDVEHQELDTILFPAPLLSELPCKLSSEESYKIIRRFVQKNINREWAKITSDYDFCFTVSKLIQLDEPVSYQYDLNQFNPRKRKPKYETRYQKYRDFKIFEMTHQAKGYQNYPIIKRFEGASYENLKENIKSFLDNLIEEINKPLVDCHCCNGVGVEVKKIETPKDGIA